MRTVRWAQGGGVGLRRGGGDVLGGVSRQDSVGLCLSQQGGRNLVVTAPVLRLLRCWLDGEQEP